MKTFAVLKISRFLNNYVMKTILSDAKSHEEHDEMKYSPIRQTTAELCMILYMDVGKIMEKEWKLKAFWTIVKKATFLAHFVD